MSNAQQQADAAKEFFQERQAAQGAKQVSLFQVGAAGVLGAVAAKVLFGNRGS